MSNAMTWVDFYKTKHHLMLPKGTTKIYSNMTARKSRIPGIDYVVIAGLQRFILKYLIEAFDETFFDRDIEEVIEEYNKFIKTDASHIRALHKLGYLPIEIKALPEGSICPIRVPFLTITNTKPEFAWLTNYLETLMSNGLWQPITSATIAYSMRKEADKYAMETTGSVEAVDWLVHDFSMRGMSGLESAEASGLGHLISFPLGSDNIPAIYSAHEYYDMKPLPGNFEHSVPATEHMIECMHHDYTTGNEDAYFERLMESFPEGLLSLVSDGFDFWKVVTETIPKHKDRIMKRNGKLVIRPDSGDPVDILCGMNFYHRDDAQGNTPQDKGLIELLWDTFGGTTNKYGYRELDSHIGAIYGDSITPDRAVQIYERLKAKGFASTNVVLGVGSYTYQFNTRDTFGMAVKATYGEITTLVGESGKDAHGAAVVQGVELFKDPKTDDGTKKSAKGLLCVLRTTVANADGTFGKTFTLMDQCNWKAEGKGALETVYRDGVLTKYTSFEDIRNTLKGFSEPVPHTIL